MDEPAAPGVVVPCRLPGVIEATQRGVTDTRAARGMRNDRLVAVADKTHRHASCRSPRDVGDGLLDEIEAFLVFYNARFDKRFTPLRRAGVAAARQRVAEGRTAFAANH